MKSLKRGIFYSHISYEDKISLLRIIRGQNIGPITFKNAMEMSNYDISECLNYFQKLCDLLGDKARNILADINVVRREYERTIEYGADFLFIVEERYPYMLRQVDYAPSVITYKGNFSILSKKSISIVGSRAPSLTGIKIAKLITHDLCKEGFLPISGMALGIDRAVHEVSIANNFKNVAVFGCGIDIIYPIENKDIYNSLVHEEGGLAITQFPFGAKPNKYNFPKRNLIIAGLSIATCVVQANIKSGALITANLAIDNGREVFAVPGSIVDSKSHGTNYLIKNGANIVLSSEDIIQTLKNTSMGKDYFLNDSYKNNAYYNLPMQFKNKACDIHEMIVGILDHNPISIKEIVDYIKLDSAKVINALIELEILGKIQWINMDCVSLSEKNYKTL